MDTFNVEEHVAEAKSYEDTPERITAIGKYMIKEIREAEWDFDTLDTENDVIDLAASEAATKFNLRLPEVDLIPDWLAELATLIGKEEYERLTDAEAHYA